MPSDELTTIREVWNEYEDEKWRRDQSHWRGEGRWAVDSKWRAIGNSTLSMLRFVWRCQNLAYFPEPPTMLEWGPGGGANLYALKSYCRTYYGVDIAEENLNECRRMISEEGYANTFQPILLKGPPQSVEGAVDQQIDIFISTAVFQHFPSKEYGVDVLKAVRRICKPNAIGIVQIRFDNGNPKFTPITSLEQYKDRHITANSYPIDEFWNILRESGFQPLFIRDINTNVNYATFCFRATSA